LHPNFIVNLRLHESTFRDDKNRKNQIPLIYASWFGAGSKLVRSQIPLRCLVRISFEPASNQLRTS